MHCYQLKGLHHILFKENWWYNNFPTISLSSLLWFIVSIFNISSIYCVHCVRFSIKKPMHVQQIYHIWINLYVPVLLRSILYSTLNNYDHPLIMMLQLKVTYQTWQNVLYQHLMLNNILFPLSLHIVRDIVYFVLCITSIRSFNESFIKIWIIFCIWIILYLFAARWCQ